MAFVVIADPPDQFAAWLANQAEPAAQASDPRSLEAPRFLQALAASPAIRFALGRSQPAARSGPI